MEIEPIAHIHTDFKEKFGIPRQSGLVRCAKGRIVFEPRYRDPSALRGIEGYSYIWLIFDFSLSHRDGWSATVRPPRLGGNTRVGVFASRSPFRPNNLGLSSVRLESVEDSDEGPVLIVSGTDLLDGTPIYDIKPYLRFADCHEDAESGYAQDVFDHSLVVMDPDDLLSALTDEQKMTLRGCLQQDPRPSYQDDGRIYTMRFSDYDISFSVCGDELTVLSLRRV